jgi:ketosteroid isomerase-like protein
MRAERARPARLSSRICVVAVADEVRELIVRYDEAWNDHDLEAIHVAHAPGIVFHNHTAGERVEGAVAVKEHIARIFANWPDLRFRNRSLYVGDGFAVSEWTATATAEDGRRLEWDGIDVFPCQDGVIVRKDVYSTSATPRVLEQ